MDVNEVPKEQGEARRRRIRKNLEECLRLGVEDRGESGRGKERPGAVVKEVGRDLLA